MRTVKINAVTKLILHLRKVRLMTALDGYEQFILEMICGIEVFGQFYNTYIHNKSYSAQSYIKTERLCITEVQTYTK